VVIPAPETCLEVILTAPDIKTAAEGLQRDVEALAVNIFNWNGFEFSD
jgi:hypothetical protein